MGQLATIEQDTIQEWLDAIADVLHYEGEAGVQALMDAMNGYLSEKGVQAGTQLTTPYVNTIKKELEAKIPDLDMLKRVAAIIRWNAVMMVIRAGKSAPELGGHIASYQSAAILYEVGFNHFFKGYSEDTHGDFLFIQGHSSPGIYSRAFLEGRLTEKQLSHFRQEVEADGLSSYPHPWLLPDFWQFPTVSMGLGPLQAIYQARFMKYLHNRKLLDTAGRHIWAFLGDGEIDEPESLGALSIAARERLDNLIFVVNCNLQRLDGPVRGNGKIIQELEGIFRGAGWHVIKVIWGSRWEKLLSEDHDGLLKKRMMECVDGEYQAFKANDGAYVRKHFFGKYPELLKRVEHMTDDEIWALNRGGHDPQKVFAAYKQAVDMQDKPVVILAKTVKGYGMGEAGEAQNITHQQKKMTVEQLKLFRDRFHLDISDKSVENFEFYKPADSSPEIKFIKAQRKELGGPLPIRKDKKEKLEIPKLDAFGPLLKSSGEREISTTMAFVRLLNILMKDKALGKRIVPIVPDESRTFGMEGMFRQYGIYSPNGQLYQPEDSGSIMYYKESVDGQLLEEGINEAGAFCSWIAAATSYSTTQYPMIPFYIYYSMFGFQRIADLAWAAGDSRARGFLLGATAGRTTLAGEGLQHQDGHSHILANTIPNCVTYDPTFAYEVAVIIQDGMRRMYVEQEDIFYYITVMNENYQQPDMPKDVEEGILKGMYCLEKAKKPNKLHVNLLGCGTILREVIAARDILKDKFKVTADIWSVTSFNELRRDAIETERYNRHHPGSKKKTSYVQDCFKNNSSPVIAATDYMRIYAEQIRSEVEQPFTVLGTDGYGRSDTRQQLRHFFEVDAKAIVLATLSTLADNGEIDVKVVKDAIKTLKINPKKESPWRV